MAEIGRNIRARVAALRWRPLWLSAAAGGACFLLMAREGQLPRGVLWGGLCLALAVVALLRALGLLQADAEARPLTDTALGRKPGELPWLSPLPAMAAALLLTLGAALIGGGVALPWAIVVALGLLVPAALRRPGLQVFVIGSALYLPLLGGFGLWDPWETHYGEVAREILARDDWISLWWAQDRWFWSKPIFIFWSEALLWSASGVGFMPDSHFQHSEWVLRLPIYLIAISALLAVYFTVSRRFDSRAGRLSALVLSTTPYFAFLSHQAITDMPFVGQMTIAVMLFLAAVHSDPEATAPRLRVGPFTVSLQELVIGLFLMLTLPQVLYLASRNVTFMDGLFAWHRDEFLSGSGHNPEVPGNSAARAQQPFARSLWAQPLSQALFWGLCIAAAVRLVLRERRTQALLMFLFYIFCALAFMAKGIPGFALPGLVALLYLLSTTRWSELLEGRFRIAPGALLLSCVGLPWFVAMYMRHGPRFTDRLLIHDHINRLTKGVHGDTGDIGYFIEQLGYGTFPWFALLPLGFAAFAQMRAHEARGDRRAVEQREFVTVLCLWFAAAFTLFSAMTTKFHHYIFPAVPPAAIVVGISLDRLLGHPAGEGKLGKRAALGLMLALVAPLPLLLGVAGLRGDVRGVLPPDLGMAERAVWALQHPWPTPLCALLIALGVLSLGAAAWLQLGSLRRDDEPSSTTAGVGAALLAGALLAAFVGRDLAWTTAERPAGAERLIQLFIYNYERPFPDYLDYRPIFGGFAIVASALLVLAAVRALRPLMLRAYLGLALLFTVFYLDVYMLDLTPHWGQRGLIDRYYGERKGPEQPLVAWQMNWKGENFYSGNRVAVFVNLNNTEVTKWMDEREGSTAYFLLEHKRLGRFRKLADKRDVEPVTSERDNNKFVLVRVAL
ncbi:MAG: glycosyltransferase family 39 protein [Myxococcales bacterium]|nr:glycosyltransferase family 39 protein [Myxococcales bacterium]